MVVLVLGSVLIRKGSEEEAMAASLEHVRRSRTEPGCLEHCVSVDSENVRRLVFVERWTSMEALNAHFAVPASRAFVKSLAAVATSPPTMALFQAEEVKFNRPNAA